jgi:hypothetical protein
VPQESVPFDAHDERQIVAAPFSQVIARTIRSVETTADPDPWNAAKSCTPTSDSAAPRIASRSSGGVTCHTYRWMNGETIGALTIRYSYNLPVALNRRVEPRLDFLHGEHADIPWQLRVQRAGQNRRLDRCRHADRGHLRKRVHARIGAGRRRGR